MKRIIAVLLLACTMLIMMASCGGAGPEKTAEKYAKAMAECDMKAASKYAAVAYDDMFDAQIAAMMQEGDMSKKEALEELSDMIGEDIKNFNDLAKYTEKQGKEELKDTYDSQYKIEVSVIAVEVLEEDAKYAAIKSAAATYESSKIILSEEVKLSKVKECCKVTVGMYIYDNKKDDIFTDSKSMELTMVKIGSKWYVLDGGSIL